MVKIRLKSCQRTFWMIPDQKTWDMPCSNSLPKQICRVLKRVMHDLYMISTSFSIISRHNHSILPTLWCRTSGEHWLHIKYVIVSLSQSNSNLKNKTRTSNRDRKYNLLDGYFLISIWRVIFEEYKYLAPNWPRQAVSTHYQEKTRGITHENFLLLLFTVVIWAGLNSGRLSLAGLSR